MNAFLWISSVIVSIFQNLTFPQRYIFFVSQLSVWSNHVTF